MPIAEILTTDAMGIAITNLVKEFHPESILEIGSSDGSGSSTVFADAIKGTDSELYCMEVTDDRFAELERRMSIYPNVICYKVSSVDINGMVDEQYVHKFRDDHRHDLNIFKQYKMSLVMSWHKEVADHIRNADIKEGIRMIKHYNGIDVFDMVLIDGSPFTAMAELDEVYGAKVIIMDDTMDIKCYDPMQLLLSDPNYELIIRNDQYRNGFAAFKWVGDE